MRRHAEWRSRALALVRHAAAAAGLGLGWLVLSGGAASAAPDSPDGLLATVVSAPASAVSSADAGPSDSPGLVGTVQRTTAPLAARPIGAAADLATTATGALASSVDALPSIAEPLTGGALEPLSPVLEPVVTGTVSTLDGALGAVGDAAQTAGDAGSAILPGPLLPVEKPAVPAIAAPADSVSAEAQEGAPAVSATPASGSGEPGAVEDSDAGISGVMPSSAADPLAKALIAQPLGRAVLAVDAAFRAALPDGPAPSFPAAPALPFTPASTGGALFGSGGDASGPAALAAAGFALALAWRAGPSARARAVPLPAAPAYDPGSTPD